MAATSCSKAQEECSGPARADMPQQLTRAARYRTRSRRMAHSSRISGSAPESGLYTVSIRATSDGLSAGTLRAFFKDSNVTRHPSFSPDGRWLAYTSNESGSSEVYVRAFLDKGDKWWSRNGHELCSTATTRIALWSPPTR